MLSHWAVDERATRLLCRKRELTAHAQKASHSLVDKDGSGQKAIIGKVVTLFHHIGRAEFTA